VRLLIKAALFTAVFQHKTTREVTKNKAALSTKKPRFAPGLIVRVQHSRTAIDKSGFISPLFSNAQQPRGHNKQSRSFNKKAVIQARLDCARATKPYGFDKCFLGQRF
jgi:hypothetical protein